MPSRRKEVVLSRGERLRDSVKQGTSLSLPLAVYHRLDLLAERAEAAEATRAEIIGMLIAEADLEQDQLEQAVLRYRKSRVGDVIPDEVEETAAEPLVDSEKVVSIRPRNPGRPVQNNSR